MKNDASIKGAGRGGRHPPTVIEKSDGSSKGKNSKKLRGGCGGRQPPPHAGQGGVWGGACSAPPPDDRKMPTTIEKVMFQLGANRKGVRIYFGYVLRFFGFFCFSSGQIRCRILQHFLAKLTHFTLARQHPQHLFQHPPHVRPTSLASPTNRGKPNRSSWRVTGVKKKCFKQEGISIPARKK